MSDKRFSPHDARDGAERFLGAAATLFVATNGSHGHPNIRAMAPALVVRADHVWFVTHLESNKLIELVKDSKAAVYGCSADSHTEVRLWGTIAILDDRDSRRRIWRDDFKRTFPGGADDPSMRVLRFDAVSGRFAKDGKVGTFGAGQ